MERYDGKTRRDDYIKYGLIALAAVLVITGICLLQHFLKKAYQKEPDYTVVIGSEEAFNSAMMEQLESLFASLVGDRNGDGRELVKVQVLRLVDYQAVQDQRLARKKCVGCGRAWGQCISGGEYIRGDHGR